MARRPAAVAAALLLLLPSAGGQASVGCETALRSAAVRHGVPDDLLVALGRVESGLNPYAVNAGGRPFFGTDTASATAYVEEAQRQGVTFIDVGCGQIDLYWHPDAFETLEAAFDASRNADYAARFLAELHARHGSWPAAVAHYHSARASAQNRYLDLVSGRLDPEDRALLTHVPGLIETLDGWDRSAAIAVYRALAADGQSDEGGDGGEEAAEALDSAAVGEATARPRIVTPASRQSRSSSSEDAPSGPRIVDVAGR